jgi:N-acetylglutamate synthase-like GNAT family acetyltransferase
MPIEYKFDHTPATQQIINLYWSAGLKRPIEDEQRIKTMYDNSNLIVTAWQGDELIGIARSLTDFCYACYLSDLAVCMRWQKQGIGKRLIELTKERIGDQTMLLLLSAPAAMEYYPKIGMNRVENGFIIPRTK